MSIRLIESPDDMVQTGALAGRYAAAFARNGTQRYVANATSRMWLAQAGQHFLPVTIDDGGYGLSYVANPHSAYVLYARREMDIVNMQRGRWAARAALGLLDAALRSARINRIVHLDNWLLSTNLHGEWKGERLGELRAELCARFPTHFLGLRTLDAWSSPQLLQAAQADGWILLPSRQVWVIDDFLHDWRPRNHVSRDRRALARSGLHVDHPEHIDANDAERIADLYAQLYVDKYSDLNPVFTADFIRLGHELRMLDHLLVRDAGGQILAVAGMLEREGVMTPPIVGYDVARPQREALYRIISFVFATAAESRGWRLHGSAGAAEFKRLRGARGVIEYMAVYAAHLDAARRAPISALAAGLERWVVPMMQREGW